MLDNFMLLEETVMDS